MPATESAPAAGPSLEQILWRSMDRFGEGPALLDAEEFAAHVSGVFEGNVPAEAWVERFFAGHPEDPLHDQNRPRDMAEAIVRATRRRLPVYEFDLARLEYVLIEDKKKVVVVSDFGQFALERDDQVSRAIESAILPGSASRQDRRSDQPRAFYVRASGEVVGVDVKKIAAALGQLMARQVSMPAVDRPATRLLPFGPAKRALNETREERALRQDPRTRAPLPPPRLSRTPAPVAAPGTSATTVLVVLPDGSLARPSIGSATRWQGMVGSLAARDQAQARAGPRFVVQAGQVVAVFTGGERQRPGSAGEKALLRGEGVAAARGEGAPTRVLGDDELARAFARGAMGISGLRERDRFWVQPEAAFRSGGEQQALAQGGRGTGTAQVVGLKLGQVTGDPWADWALTGGEVWKAALDRGPGPAAETAFPGSRVVAFRAPDGSVLVQRASGTVRLAANDRSAGPSRAGPLAPRAGAIPATALASLQLALERTAMAGGFHLPMLKIATAPDAVEAGRGLSSDGLARLAGPASRQGTTARLVLSMPFPNAGEMHVGPDLEAALQAVVGGTVAPVAIRLRAAPPDFAEPRSLHARALGSARQALFKLDVEDPGQLSGLPHLLAQAVEQGGSWQPGRGAPLPSALRQVAFGAPFAAAPELAFSAGPAEPRALRPGEDEIVIPLPLWSQMGRGQVSETEQIMASPLSPRASTPPLGVYQLVAPAGTPLDFTSSSSPAVQVHGPGLLQLGARGSQVSARVAGGSFNLGKIALDVPRGRMRLGAPLDPVALREMRESASPALPRLELPRPGPAALAAPQPQAGPALPPGDGAPLRSAPQGGAVDAFLARAHAAGSALAGQLPSLTATPVLAGLPPSIALPDVTSPRSASGAGLAPGMWSGHRPSAEGYQRWTYGESVPARSFSSSGVDLSGLARPQYPSIPSALRFRYAGAPLWWSRATRSIGGAAAEDATEAPLRSGLRAANSAAALWRSIFTAGSLSADVSGGMDAGRDASADEMSALGRKLDALAGAALAGPGAAGRGAETVYVAMNGSGRAGTMTASAAHRARAQALELSIVAAIPPSPPPLESMGGGAVSAEAPHARGKGAHAAHGPAKEHEDAVSHSKIEGSVDAIAQRIYHRIRRRIQSDRERFGG